MSLEKIGNITDIASTNMKTKANIERQTDPQPENTHGDVVSVGSSEKASDATKIQWPPFFPIGDVQSIFKVGK